MRRHISYALLTLSALLLTLGTLTPIFAKPVSQLPPHSDLFFHFVAHALLTITMGVTFSSVPREGVLFISVAVALALELAQALFVRSRSAHAADVLAAALGSLLLFLIPRDGKLVPPSYTQLINWISPDDDDEDDGESHRVTSWAV